MRDLLYRKGIPVRKRLLLKIEMTINNCTSPTAIIDHILMKGLSEKQVIISKPIKIEEIARAIILIERDSNVATKVKISLVLVDKLIYRAEMTSVMVIFIDELLVDNNVITSARHKEKVLSPKTDSLLNLLVFMIL